MFQKKYFLILTLIGIAIGLSLNVDNPTRTSAAKKSPQLAQKVSKNYAVSDSKKKVKVAKKQKKNYKKAAKKQVKVAKKQKKNYKKAYKPSAKKQVAKKSIKGKGKGKGQKFAKNNRGKSTHSGYYHKKHNARR